VIFSDVTGRKRAETARLAALDDLVTAQRLCQIGHWSFDVTTGVVRWSDELYRIFDVPSDQFGGLYQSFIDCVHPEDRAMVLEANRTARVAGTSFQLDYRIIRKGGEVRVIREVGHSERDGNGDVTRLFGVAQDVTDWNPVPMAHRKWKGSNALRDVA
jgi:PAS domain-containing protein